MIKIYNFNHYHLFVKTCKSLNINYICNNKEIEPESL